MPDAALRRHGFEAVVAATGDEAVAVYCEHREVIAAVLLDVRMPHQDGPATLRDIDAEVRAGFMSGDTGGYTTHDLLRAGAWFVIAKPFNVAEDALRRLAGAG